MVTRCYDRYIPDAGAATGAALTVEIDKIAATAMKVWKKLNCMLESSEGWVVAGL